MVNYLFMVAEEARQIMAELGFRTIDEMIGRVDCLEIDDADPTLEGRRLDLTPILTPAEKPHDDVEVVLHAASRTTAWRRRSTIELIELAQPALERDEQVVRSNSPISNTNRTVGTMLSHEIVKQCGEQGLPRRHDPHQVAPARPARASARSWRKGVTLELEGDANDYVGKGLSGGRVIVYPPSDSHVRAGGEHHRRQRGALRRHRRAGLLPRHGRPSGSASATAVPAPWSKASATTAANT